MKLFWALLTRSHALISKLNKNNSPGYFHKILSRPPPVGCRSCPPASKTGSLPSLQFPWGYRLTIGCSRGIVKGKGVPRVFLLSFAFGTCVPAFYTTTIWDTSGQGWSRKLLLQFFFFFSLRRATQTIGAWFVQVKLVSVLIVFQIKLWSCLAMNPDACLASTSGGGLVQAYLPASSRPALG